MALMHVEIEISDIPEVMVHLMVAKMRELPCVHRAH
jgi:hypothetical protein